MAKMEPADKDIIESIDFNVEGEDMYEAQGKDKAIKKVKKSDVSIDMLSVHPTIQGYSAMPDILASFRRTLRPRPPSPS